MLNANSSKQINLNASLLYFNILKIDLKTSLALQFYFAVNIQISESLHREIIFKHHLLTPFKPVEKLINFWKVVLSGIPYFREELKDVS